MKLKEIIKNLEHYNDWRRDNDNEYTMPEPKKLGITIDEAIIKLNELLICDVGCSLKNKQVPTLEEYLKLCYIKLNHNYRSKETLQNYSLEEIEQIYNWMKNL